MVIYSNDKSLVDCCSIMEMIGHKMQCIPDNIYNLASQNPDIVITRENVNKACKEFPTTTFVYIGTEGVTFPAVKSEYFQYEWGFDSLEAIPFVSTESTRDVLFVNNGGRETKYVAQYIRSKYPNVHIYGHAFSIHGLNEPIDNISSLMCHYETIISGDFKVLCKALQMNKKALLSGLDNNISELPEDTKWYDNTNFDKMAQILNNSNPEISEQLLKTKEKIHAKN